MDVINSMINGVETGIAKIVDMQSIEQVSQINTTDQCDIIIKQNEDVKPIQSNSKFSIKSLISYCVAKSPLTKKEIASLGILGLVKFLPTNYIVLASTAIILWNMPKAQFKLETK